MNNNNNNSKNSFFQMPVMMNNEFNAKSLLESDQFPDVLNYLNNEQIKVLFELMNSGNYSHLVNKPGPLGGYSALHWMAIKNELELMEYLLVKCNADVNCKATLGETPLHICIKNNNLYTIELLIQHGADLNCRDSYDRSIIHWCAYSGRVILFTYFRKYHYINNFNEVDQFQQNALHIACACGFADLINYLLANADIDLLAQDSNGNTCLHMAAKCGLTRICWLITRHNKGEGVKLLGIKNNQDQTPFDFIRNERALHFRKLRSWMRLEYNSNPWLMEKFSNERQRLNEFKSNSMPLYRFIQNIPIFRWTSYRLMQAEWLLRLLIFLIVLTIPAAINTYILYPGELSVAKGVVGYFTFIAILLVVFKQKHRISHISGLENPYFLGFFSSLFVHNYSCYYFVLLENFSIFTITDFLILIFTIWHFYSFYAIMVTDPGFCKESLKKPDGSPYEIKDLMKINAKSFKNTRDSINWLTEPSSHLFYSSNDQTQLYFCESCQLIQSLPTKHCKLCEKCCLKFDHHCLFIRKCVGLKNHRTFIYFLLSTIICICIFLYTIVLYMYEFSQTLDSQFRDKAPEEKITFFYALFSSGLHIWITVLFIVNFFTLFMVTFLLLFQIKFISLGFTSQFPPPMHFIKINKHMASFVSAFIHRLENLYTFFFESCETNQELYYRQQNEYKQAILNGKSIPLPYVGYPRNNEFDNYPMNNQLGNHNHFNPMEKNINNPNMNNNMKSKLLNDKNFEIDLD